MITVLMYHEVTGEKSKRREAPSLYVSIEDFLNHLEYVEEKQYKTADTKIFTKFENSDREKKVMFTFDDGYEGNYRLVFPALKKYNMKGVFFISTDLVGKDNMLSWENLKGMSKEGMDIQSHTVTHRPLVKLSDKEIKKELYLSRIILEDNLNKNVEFLSLPHGLYNKKVLESAKETGYKAIFCSYPGYTTQFCPDLPVSRIQIKGSYSLGYFGKIIDKAGGIGYYLKTQQAVKTTVKFFMGLENYRSVYRMFNGINRNREGINNNESKRNNTDS